MSNGAVIALVAALASALATVLAVAALRRPRRPPPRPPRPPRPDPGRQLRAERRAEGLLRSVVSEAEWGAYRALGFLGVYGPPDAAPGEHSYGYLIYPHRPIVGFDARTGEPYGEYCVEFPDRSGAEHGERLPDADDVLAKWMALRADEERLLTAANMHLPGRQIDPAQARRDVARLGEWLGREPSGSRLS